MFKKTQINEKYLLASKEHTQVYEYLETFKSFIKKGNKNFTVKDLKKTLTRFEKDIKDHFRLEEEVLFPAALVCMPSLDVIDQVLALQKEHGYFEKDLETLIILAGKYQKRSALINAVSALMKSFIASMQNHARIEIEEIFNKMDNTSRCKKLIKGITIPG